MSGSWISSVVKTISSAVSLLPSCHKISDRIFTVYSSPSSLVEIADAAAASLQHPSASSATVAVATPTELLQIPVGGGDATVTASGGAKGVPAQPVQLAGCTYSAWSCSNRFVRDCLTDSQDAKAEIDRADPEAEFMFRVNREVVVLNDTFGGTAWMASVFMPAGKVAR